MACKRKEAERKRKSEAKGGFAWIFEIVVCETRLRAFAGLRVLGLFVSRVYETPYFRLVLFCGAVNGNEQTHARGRGLNEAGRARNKKTESVE